MNQCARTFTLVGLVVVILLALHLMPAPVVVNQHLRRVNLLSDLFPEVVRDDEAHNLTPVPIVPKPVKVVAVVDSSMAAVDTTVVAVVDTLPEKTGLIDDYSMGQPGGMAHFYRQLALVEQLDRPVRVAYYGDSFIEGDILSADLREGLQSRFGGSGVGWVDCASQIAGFRQTVGLWSEGLTEYEVVKKPYKHQVEGISQRYFVPEEGAKFTVKGCKARKHLDCWQRALLFLRSGQSLDIVARFGGDTIEKHLEGSPEVQMATFAADSVSRASFSFSNVKEETYLYGVALESERGVILDNFSMRGSSGTSLADIPMSTLCEFARFRDYDLIILHFGLNVANEKSLASTYKVYTEKMGRVIEHFREAFPQASILVVSMPDRDQRTSAGIRTMNGVESLVAYQQIMAADHQVAFFNLFKAMGGRESMKELVDRGLANKDYTHLSFAGGREIAKIFLEHLLEGYGE